MTTTLKSLASSVPEVDWRGGNAGRAQECLVADLCDVTLEDFAGQGIDGDVGGLTELHIDDVGLVDLDLRGDDGHIGEGHEGGALGVLDADDDGLTLAHGDVGDEAVEGSAGDGLIEGVEVGALAGDGLIEMGPLAVGLRLGLGEGCDALVESGGGDIVGGFFGVEVLLGDELGVVEGLGAVEVEFFLLEVCLGLGDVGLGGVLGGDVGGDVGLGGGDGRLLGVDGGLRLDAFHACHDVALMDVVALLDIEVGDAAEGGGADVDVGLGLDLAGAADRGDEVLAHDLAGGDFDDAGLAVQDGAGDDARHSKDDDDDCDDLLGAHSIFLNAHSYMRAEGPGISCAEERARQAANRYAIEAAMVPLPPG